MGAPARLSARGAFLSPVVVNSTRKPSWRPSTWASDGGICALQPGGPGTRLPRGPAATDRGGQHPPQFP